MRYWLLVVYISDGCVGVCGIVFHTERVEAGRADDGGTGTGTGTGPTRVVVRDGLVGAGGRYNIVDVFEEGNCLRVFEEGNCLRVWEGVGGCGVDRVITGANT